MGTIQTTANGERTALDVRKLVGQKLRLHWNVRKKKWSVLRKGRVIGHVAQIALVDVNFVIQAAGARRAVETGVRNVHAFAEGIVAAPLPPPTNLDGLDWVIYRANLGFVLVRNGLRVECAKRAELTKTGALWVS